MDRGEKIYAGPRLKRERKALGLTQAQLADALGLSPSYLNLMERNQRPITARVLLALATTFDMDVRSFGAEHDRQMLADLKEAIGDPALEGVELDMRDMQDLADVHPRGAEALARVFRAYKETQNAATDLAARAVEGVTPGAGLSPLEEVRDALDEASNHFPALEEAAERLRAGLPDAETFPAQLRAQLKANHGAVVRIYDDEVMGGALRRFDFHARKLLLSDMLEPAGRTFHTAAALVSLELGALLDEEARKAPGLSESARTVFRSSLVNYAAAALLMPYAAFHQAAERGRYDIDALARKFDSSFEQVCHRLTTLHRPGASGVAFFMLRVDQAGNVTKRFGGGVLAFARSGGGCARWRVYDAFRAPEKVHVQGFELPDGQRYISMTKAVTHPQADGPAVMNAVTVGCAADQVDRLIYRAGDTFTPTGLSCRLCERENCAERAFPPLQRQIKADPHIRGATPFAF
jgi:predicted transcriptional regulator/transcriptional regulator with XRE-family HTH domain